MSSNSPFSKDPLGEFRGSFSEDVSKKTYAEVAATVPTKVRPSTPNNGKVSLNTKPQEPIVFKTVMKTIRKKVKRRQTIQTEDQESIQKKDESSFLSLDAPKKKKRKIAKSLEKKKTDIVVPAKRKGPIGLKASKQAKKELPPLVRSTSTSRVTNKKRVNPFKPQKPTKRFDTSPTSFQPDPHRVQQEGGSKKKKKKTLRTKNSSIVNPPIYVSPNVFPTSEELEYLAKWTIQSSTEKFTRGNAGYVEMTPIRIKFKNLTSFPGKPELHYHLAKLFDIFIRKNLQKVGGDLKTTQYWFQLDSPGYREKDGWFVTHETHADCNGLTLMNILGQHMNSNENIRLADGFAISMNIFKDAPKKKMVGRGAEDYCVDMVDVSGEGEDMYDMDEESEEEDVGVEPEDPETAFEIARGDLALEKALIKRKFGKPNVQGNTHCLAKALALGKIWSDRKRSNDPDVKKELTRAWENATRSNNKQAAIGNQLKWGKKLLRDAGMDEDQTEHTREDLEKLALHMKDYQITLWKCGDGDIVPREDAIYNEDGLGFIGILYHRGHFDYVNHTKGDKRASYCYKCFKWGNKDHARRCKAKCFKCGTTNCPGEGRETIECPACNVKFKSQTCFDNHKKSQTAQSKPNCDVFFYCKQCKKYDKKMRPSGVPHICGATKFCKVCRKKASPIHQCIHAIPTLKEKEKRRERQKTWTHVVYDMECIVAETGTLTDAPIRGPKHVPNMICAKLMCEKCRGGACDRCGDYMTYSYKDESTDPTDKNPVLTRFMKFLLEDPRTNGAQIIAQNGGGYDHPMLIGAMLDYIDADGAQPKLLLNGMKIIRAEIRYKKKVLYFLDSLQFLQMGLAKMPNAFGLTGEAKGYFPYLWNHPDHYDEVLPTLPPKGYYNPKCMGKEKEDFDKWYDENRNNQFELHTEMEKYCISDVRILVLAIAKFIEMCETAFDQWHPLLNSCTLASYVMFVLKNIYIQPGDVGVIPEYGYTGGGNNSALALKYIQWLEKKNPGLKLQYKLQGGEKQINVGEKTYSLDAYNEETKEIYEVHGCVFHGCPKCFPVQDKRSTVNPEKRMGDLLDATIEREENLRAAGYTVHTKWECEINAELAKDKEMRKFFRLCKYTHRLKPRDALYGGRTQAFKSRVEATKDRSLHYLDFTSLYPWLNAMGTAYPRGNPKVMTDGFPSTDEPLKLRGLAFCDVLPNPEADIGYLPQKLHNKLMFMLCRSCGEEQNISGLCTHTKVSERYLTGTWCTDELNLAISKGYKVLRYHEIHYWPDKDWVTGGFFADYIKPLLKMKHESSGWPQQDMSDEAKEAYITKILENDGVKLDPANIKVNKALRSLAKLFLNSAWGKFAQNPIKTETKLIHKSDSVTMKNFFNDYRYKPTAMITLGRRLFLSRTPRKECVNPVDSFTNLMIGAQTTCGGRLRLHLAMAMAGYANMIYCDTDSVIFSAKRGEDPLKELKGEQLGYLTNEIPEGFELMSVVVMAPKVYGLKMQDKNGKEAYVVKVKGITLDCEGSKIITFNSMDNAMKEFISNGSAEALKVQQSTIKRGDHPLDGLYSMTFDKKLTPQMDKGHYDSEGTIIPFGRLPDGTNIIDDYPFYY